MDNLLKPEYLWRPRQILRRVFFRPEREAVLPLPWNCTINACSLEIIGRAIATQGVYDLALTEALIRLTDPGETAIDAGANIGYASLVLALAAGPSGRVIAFEPNSDVVPVLQANLTNWQQLKVAPIDLHTVALSDHDGQGYLGFPPDYDQNHGVASLEAPGSIPVQLSRLDSLPIQTAGVMKMDVEGHEASVLKGAERFLAGRRIRDIVFEENGDYPAPSHDLLSAHGYQLFRLTRSPWRPLLLPAVEPPRDTHTPSNFLATVDPSRAKRRFAEWGWRALRKFKTGQ